MFNQGLQRGSFKVVWLAGLLNLPYYLLLIAATAYLSEDVLQLAENTRLILILLACWLLIGLALDIRRYLINKNA